MRNWKWKVIALCLAAAMLFSGCSTLLEEAMERAGKEDILDRVTQGLLSPQTVHFYDMEYSRPDLAEFDRALENVCDLAANEKDLDAVVDGIYAFYEVYDAFYTNYALADIHYSADLTDIYWEEEYNYCSENISAADAGLEELYYALADSPHREALEDEEYFGAGYFDAYDGENLWDEGFVELMDQEAALQTRYYELSGDAMGVEYYSEEYFTQYGDQMAQLLVELIALRQQIAAYAGYESYAEFAYDMYHYRDYTPQEAEAYMEQIPGQLGDAYRKINESDVWDIALIDCGEEETFAYLESAAKAMGGTVEEAFSFLDAGGLYDISYGMNKYDSSFEVYLWSYYSPFVFMNPTMTPVDKLTFAHEFGHFANDYVCYGSVAGTDVAEVHSQALEYLSLCCQDEQTQLLEYKMADNLCTYVEQAAYALFEQRAYELTGDDLTAENLQKLYEEIGLEFGFDSWAWDSRDFVTITHFYTSPMYIISYVVSNDVAFQLYQLERQSPGQGVQTYQQCLESMDSYILYFAESYGLESPFAEGRLESVRKSLEEELANYL